MFLVACQHIDSHSLERSSKQQPREVATMRDATPVRIAAFFSSQRSSVVLQPLCLLFMISLTLHFSTIVQNIANFGLNNSHEDRN
eukprot:scaffold1839_cov31-Prasinocladus_malaysianus.AAC.2